MRRAHAVIVVLMSAPTLWAAMLPPAWGDPGDIVIIRKVDGRIAYRPGTGPVMAKTNPGADTQDALGLNQFPGGIVAHELSNREVAGVTTGMPVGTINGVANVKGAAVGMTGVAGFITGGGYGGAAAGQSISGTIGGAGAAAGSMAQQAGGQVMDALKGIGLIGK